MCSELSFAILSDKEYYKLLDSINSLPGRRFNLQKQDFESIRQRFSDYF
ncbi:MAG: hypothetical protein QXK90_01265 [Candidatus Parvarchaeota archaeon]